MLYSDGDPLSTKTKECNLKKADLIEKVCELVQIPRKEATVIVELILDAMVQALRRGEKVEIRGFGSFRTRQRRGRIGRNPKTGARVEVPPKKNPFFKPSKELKDHVNSGSPLAPVAPAPGPAPATPQG